MAKKILKEGINNEVWFKKDRDPTLVLYSNTKCEREMRKVLCAITESDITIIKLLDDHISFIINCMIFERLTKQISPSIQKIKKEFEIDL